MRKVGPQLWIGNAFDARNLTLVLDTGIEAIVDLAIEEPPILVTRELVCCRIPISDGTGNPPARIRFAVETICHLISSEVSTLVACSAGMSRSPAFVAAAMSQLSGITLDEALGRVAGAGPSDLSPALVGDIAATLE